MSETGRWTQPAGWGPSFRQIAPIVVGALVVVVCGCADYDAGQPEPPWVVKSVGSSFSGNTPSPRGGAPLTRVDSWAPTQPDAGGAADAQAPDAGSYPRADVIWWDVGHDGGEPRSGSDAAAQDAAQDTQEGDAAGAPPDIISPPQDAGATDTDPPDAGGVDGGPVDVGDVGAPDTGAPDTGATDTGPTDGGPVDSGPTDSGPTDSGPTDSGPTDAGLADAVVDGGLADAGPTDAGADVFDAAWDPDWSGYGDVSFADGSDVHGGVLDSCWSLFGIVFEETCTNNDLTVACVDAESALGSIYAQYLFEPLRKCMVANCIPKCTGPDSKACVEQCRGKHCAYPLFACASEGVSGSQDCPTTFACMQTYENKFFSMAFHCFGKASAPAKKQLAEFFACGTEPQTDSCFDQIAACYGPTGNLTCGETIACSDNCPPGDDVCGFECIGKADADAQLKLDALWDCIIANCQGQPDSCISQKCPLQTTDCITDK